MTLPVELAHEPPLPRKVCHYCKTEKLLSEFYRDRHTHQIGCKVCSTKKNRVRSRIHRHTPPKPSVCDCCGTVPQGRWCMDHDHKTERFRGWVCERCNIGLGKFGDDVAGLEQALRYLRRCEDAEEANANNTAWRHSDGE